LLCLALLSSACNGSSTAAPVGVTASPSPARPPATPTATPQPSPSPTPGNVACPDGRSDSIARLDDLEEAVTEAMAGYPGTWGFAVRDLGCDTALAVNPGYAQYPASAGKIVTVIATLREVEAGRLDLEAVWGQVTGIMTYSWDLSADVLTRQLTPAAVQSVLADAGVSDKARFLHSWRRAYMSPMDLAIVWEALVQGELLSEEMTERLLDLAAGAVIPASLDTFPAELDLPGYQYGQKAGYYVSDGVPYFLVGAGYLISTRADGPRYTMVLMTRSTERDLSHPQRREVFDLLLAYAGLEAD
jgi:hypothetical protein